jgi:hypothetical protein
MLLPPKHIFPQGEHLLFHIVKPNRSIQSAVILMRAYAFTGRNKTVLAILCTAYLAMVAAYMWLFCSQFVGNVFSFYLRRSASLFVHGFTAVKELYWMFGESGCFANDDHAESGSMFTYTRATRTGVSISLPHTRTCFPHLM